MIKIMADVALTVTVLLLAIMNHSNIKRIENLEKWVNVLIYNKGGDINE